MPTEVLYAVIGGLSLLLLRDFLGPWLGSISKGQNTQASDIAGIKAELRSMKEKQDAHDGLLVAFTRLEERLGQVQQSVANQPALIATTVAQALKVIFAELRVAPAPHRG